MRLEHAQRGGQRGERGTQLVAHVRGEARLAFDALEEGVGHPVERGRQGRELGIVGRHQADVRDDRRRSSRPPWTPRPGAAGPVRWPTGR